MKCRILTAVALLLPALLSVLALIFDLTTYQSHMENGLLTMLVSGFSAAGYLVWMALHWIIRGHERKELIPALSAMLLVCAIVFLTATKIPFCPICDQITSEELGILNRWIPGRDQEIAH